MKIAANINQILRTNLGIIFVGLVILLMTTSPVSAQITNPVIGELGQGIGDTSGDEKSAELFANFFVSIWQAVIMFGGLTVLVFYIWGAFEWITAGSDTSKAEKARYRITNATIGLILLISTFVIVGFVSTALFGEEFQILNLSLPTTQIGAP